MSDERLSVMVYTLFNAQPVLGVPYTYQGVVGKANYNYNGI